MKIIEKSYNFKKNLLKNLKQLYTDYFTIEGTYTSLLPDKIYLKKLYKKKTGQELNLKNPVTFNEKLNWLKLYNRKPEYTMMVDKYRVREFIKEKIGEEYLVPLLGVYNRVEEIDFDALPNQFVLKCNHDSEVVICKDKENNDFMCKKGKLNSIEEVKAYLEKRLRINFYKASREWPYKNIKRKIICEQYLKNIDGTQLLEYNVFCFNGVPKFFKVGTRKNDDTLIKAFYDLDWIYIDLSTGEMAGDIFDRPKFLEEMMEIAKLFSKDTSHLRVDFFVCNDKLYSGELTFFSAGGFWNPQPQQWNYTLGEYIELPKKKRRAR
jgi:hypothetical protein